MKNKPFKLFVVYFILEILTAVLLCSKREISVLHTANLTKYNITCKSIVILSSHIYIIVFILNFRPVQLCWVITDPATNLKCLPVS